MCSTKAFDKAFAWVLSASFLQPIELVRFVGVSRFHRNLCSEYEQLLWQQACIHSWQLKSDTIVDTMEPTPVLMPWRQAYQCFRAFQFRVVKPEKILPPAQSLTQANPLSLFTSRSWTPPPDTFKNFTTSTEFEWKLTPREFLQMATSLTKVLTTDLTKSVISTREEKTQSWHAVTLEPVDDEGDNKSFSFNLEVPEAQIAHLCFRVVWETSEDKSVGRLKYEVDNCDPGVFFRTTRDCFLQFYFFIPGPTVRVVADDPFPLQCSYEWTTHLARDKKLYEQLVDAGFFSARRSGRRQLRLLVRSFTK